ncbi:50S ribosomal protein L23 [bacterium HR35]|nr:50S ribosomal protein L23 [bacterium HR35]
MSLWDKIWGGKIWGKKKEEEEKKKKEEDFKVDEKKISLKSSLTANYLFVPLITEKSMNLIREQNAYTFIVDHRLNKNQIKKIVKELFGVKIKKIRTANYKKRVRGIYLIKSTRPRFKKAVIFLEAGEKIPIFE